MGAIVDRDLQTAAEVEHLYKLNYFSEEMTVYATAYTEQGTVKYRFHKNPVPIYSFCSTAPTENLFPLPIETYVTMKKIETGTHETERDAFIQEIVQQIGDTYPIELFRLQQSYQQAIANDAAYDILVQWKKELLACFTLEPILLFQGAVMMAMEAKHLSKSAFHVFMQWSNDRKQQIVDGQGVADQKTRTFSGFCYQDGGKWKVFSNAVPEVVQERANGFNKQGIFCTPILQKTYLLESNPTWRIAQWKEYFETMLQQVMDEAYFAKLDALRSIPAVIDTAPFHVLLQNCTEQKQQNAVEVLRYYAIQWNIYLEV